MNKFEIGVATLSTISLLSIALWYKIIVLILTFTSL